MASELALAVDATDAGGLTTRPHLLDCWTRAHDFMQFVDGALVRIAGVTAPASCWVGGGLCELLPHRIGCIGQVEGDVLVLGLAHLVEAAPIILSH